MAEVIHTPDSGPPSPPSPSINFALVLSRMIDSVEQNPAELRAAVYELARVKLIEQFGHEDDAEVKRLAGALEEAIEGVESFSRHETEMKTQATALLASRGGADPADAGGPPIASAAGNRVHDALARSRPVLPEVMRNHARGMFGAVGRLSALGLALMLIGATVLFWPQLRHLRPFYAEKAAPAAAMVALPPPPPPLGFPVPTTFGVYAITGNQLQELKPLAVKVPDVRVAISAAVATPSETRLPDGDLKFIVFRRDIVANAPDRIDVRVIARVTREMGVDSSGKGRITPAQEASWVIRNITIRYKVGPVDRHPEMVLVQAERPDASLPPGRYALAVKDQAYDFTVVGPITDPRQCMERIDASNGTFYAPCR